MAGLGLYPVPVPWPTVAALHCEHCIRNFYLENTQDCTADLEALLVKVMVCVRLASGFFQSTLPHLLAQVLLCSEGVYRATFVGGVFPCLLPSLPSFRLSLPLVLCSCLSRLFCECSGGSVMEPFHPSVMYWAIWPWNNIVLEGLRSVQNVLGRFLCFSC